MSNYLSLFLTNFFLVYCKIKKVEIKNTYKFCHNFLKLVYLREKKYYLYFI